MYEPNSNSIKTLELRGPKGECPICGHPYDNHIKGECPENIKGQLELATRVLDRYIPTNASQMQMNLDIARINFLMSLYRGEK